MEGWRIEGGGTEDNGVEGRGKEVCRDGGTKDVGVRG